MHYGFFYFFSTFRYDIISFVIVFDKLFPQRFDAMADALAYFACSVADFC